MGDRLNRKFLHSLLAVMLCAFLAGSGFAAAQHDCTDTSRHDPDRCALCSVASSAAATTAVFDLSVDQPAAICAPLLISLPAGCPLPSPSDPRAPPVL
ncbi:MAG TPA: hypothetical protein VGL38_15495 [bacterium]